MTRWQSVRGEALRGDEAAASAKGSKHPNIPMSKPRQKWQLHTLLSCPDPPTAGSLRKQLGASEMHLVLPVCQ